MSPIVRVLHVVDCPNTGVALERIRAASDDVHVETIEITTEQVREAVAEPISAIVDAVKTTLDKTPPELAADIMEDGITITGGGALIGGLDQRLAHETGMPIRIADEPLYSVVIGSGRALENIDAMRGLMSLGGED